ncbi:hypothetical protein CR513_05571, partial [Mucuna pruriens]
MYGYVLRLARKSKRYTHTHSLSDTHFVPKTTKFTSHLLVPWCFTKCLVDQVGAGPKSGSGWLLRGDCQGTLTHCLVIQHLSTKPSKVEYYNYCDNPLDEPNPMENNNKRTLKELTTLDVPHKHLKEFHVVCSMMRP